MRRWLMVLVMAVGPASLVALTPGTAFAQDCSDFDDQQEAQEFFDAFPEDAADLDADDDGVACEELPSLAVDPAADTGTTVAAASTGATGATTASTVGARASRSDSGVATAGGSAAINATALAGTGVDSAMWLMIAISLVGCGALILRMTRAREATVASALLALRAIYETDARRHRPG